MVKLSNRLHTIAHQVPKSSRLADIGSDHALLPVYLIQQGRVPFAIAGEVNPGPFEAAGRQVKEAGLADQVQVRLGDGLQVIEPGEVEVITIAGMGGALIAHILEQGKQKLNGVHTLVLQPNVGEDQVRRWLVHNGWKLTDEIILEEDGKYYEILTAANAANEIDQESVKAPYAPQTLECGLTVDEALLYRMGPYLLQKPNDAFFAKWRSELAKSNVVAGEMTRSDSESAKQRREALLEEITITEEVLACLRMGRP
jgi:tRNA (adenine22-N1)-methyltransferase